MDKRSRKNQTTKHMNNKTIWCLFSIQNEYDQPDNNLVAWWFEKPEINIIRAIVDDKVDISIFERPFRESYCGTKFRIEQLNEGKVEKP